MHFIKLIRPINMAIIVLTMYGVRYYIQSVNYYQKIDDNGIDFFLLVFSTVLIAAAGNIINDYFDVKADRINRPEKLIITKHIKRRWAILVHWIFNGVAFTIALYLSAKYQSLWFVFIHLLSINALWFYSMLFKRKIIIGNIIVAGLTALVPLLVMIYFKVGNSNSIPYSEFNPESWRPIIDDTIIYLYLLAAFAFIQNFAREIVKDAQDVDGDKLIYVKSLPMAIGERKSLVLVGILLFILPVFYTGTAIYNLNIGYLSKTVPFLCASLINLFVVVWIFSSKKSSLKLLNNLIKIAMLVGVLGTYYLAYFHL
ncbi:MAG: hypothetical protein RL265_1778 [Bacteroidota bacterium]|jgi:4-hydroxybenzoate polyprenyltransferase